MALRKSDVEGKKVELLGKELSLEEYKEVKVKLKKNESLFAVYEFSEEELQKYVARFRTEASMIGGMPQHHSEALEKRGWMLPILLAADMLFTGRWDYWFDILEKGTIEGSGPIPQIQWSKNNEAQHQVKKMLLECLDGVHHKGGTISDFADWLLWGMAGTDTPPNISAEVNEHFYRTFNLEAVLRHPTDYLSGLLEEASSMGMKQALGYFSTPFDVTKMMADMAIGTPDTPEQLEEMKGKSVCDPCVGCGAMLLPASNYMLFGYGQDINPVAIKLCRVQMYWYAPWYAINPLEPKKLR